MIETVFPNVVLCLLINIYLLFLLPILFHSGSLGLSASSALDFLNLLSIEA